LFVGFEVSGLENTTDYNTWLIPLIKLYWNLSSMQRKPRYFRRTSPLDHNKLQVFL